MFRPSQRGDSRGPVVLHRSWCQELVRRAFEGRDLEKLKLIVAELHRVLDEAQRIRSLGYENRRGETIIFPA